MLPNVVSTVGKVIAPAGFWPRRPKPEEAPQRAQIKPNSVGAKDSHHNPKVSLHSVIEKRTKNWFSDIGIFSEF